MEEAPEEPESDHGSTDEEAEHSHDALWEQLQRQDEKTRRKTKKRKPGGGIDDLAGNGEFLSSLKTWKSRTNICQTGVSCLLMLQHKCLHHDRHQIVGYLAPFECDKHVDHLQRLARNQPSITQT